MNRFLALDYGTKRIGLAISDETLTLATPLEFLPAVSLKKVLGKLRSLIGENKVSLIIVGIPRNMDGSYGPSAENAREFARRLQESLTIPVEMVDERLTTVQAGSFLQEAGKNTRKQKAKIDSASAQIILQTYLDLRQNKLNL